MLEITITVVQLAELQAHLILMADQVHSYPYATQTSLMNLANRLDDWMLKPQRQAAAAGTALAVSGARRSRRSDGRK